MAHMETPGARANAAGGGERIASRANARILPRPGIGRDLSVWREAVTAGATLGELLSRPGVPLRSAVRLVRATLETADSWREREGLEPGILDALEAVPAVETPDCLWTPDFLRTQDDWRRELVAAWAALPAEDRAAFLARVSGGGAP